MNGPDFNTEKNLHADTVAERWESNQEGQMEEFSFPVVNGMVAVEHVRYLCQERQRLIEALKLALRGLDPQDDANRGSVTHNLRSLLRDLGED